MQGSRARRPPRGPTPSPGRQEGRRSLPGGRTASESSRAGRLHGDPMIRARDGAGSATAPVPGPDSARDSLGRRARAPDHDSRRATGTVMKGMVYIDSECTRPCAVSRHARGPAPHRTRSGRPGPATGKWSKILHRSGINQIIPNNSKHGHGPVWPGLRPRRSVIRGSESFGERCPGLQVPRQ